MNNAQQIAFLIKQLTKDKNITIKQLLENCELNINTISELAKGKQLSYVNFAKIADCLGVSVDYLLGRTEEPQVINQYNNGDNVNINKSSLSDTDNELISEFKKLTFTDKAKVMSLIAELSEKKS